MSENVRDRHNSLTKRIICNSFFKLLDEKPPEMIRVTDVCKLANVSRGTFYNHYMDIRDLNDYIDNWYPNMIMSSIDKLFTVKESTSAQNLEALSEILNNLASWPEYSIYLFGSEEYRLALAKTSPLIIEKHSEWFKKFYSGMDSKKAEYFVHAAIDGGIAVLRKWVKDGFREPAEYLIRFFADIKKI